jgi:phage tail protein X
MDCPSCGRNNIVTPKCPQCDIDISALFLIENIQIPPSDIMEIGRPRSRTVRMVTLTSVLLIIIGWLGYDRVNISGELQNSQRNLASLRDSLNPSVNPASPPPMKRDPGFHYKVRRGDSVWRIAQRFYGTGALASRIIDANPAILKRDNHLPVGVIVVIPPKID